MLNSSTPSGDSFGPLSQYIEPYLTHVKEQGYALASMHEQVFVLKLFDRWLKRRGRGVGDMNEALTCNFLSRAMKRRSLKSSAPSTLRRLLELLRQLGATPPAKAARPSRSEQLACAYERFLLTERALAQGTVVWHRRFVTRFLFEEFGDGPLRLAKIRATDVTAFVQRHAYRYGPAEATNLLAATRSFLRFLHYKGLVDRDQLTSHHGQLTPRREPSLDPAEH